MRYRRIRRRKFTPAQKRLYDTYDEAQLKAAVITEGLAIATRSIYGIEEFNRVRALFDTLLAPAMELEKTRAAAERSVPRMRRRRSVTSGADSAAATTEKAN